MADWQHVGKHIARKYNIPWRLFNAMINQESGWNPNAVSPAGAIGFGQLMPGTAQGLGVNPYKPRQNLRGAAAYLSQQYRNFGKWNLALSAYNSGPGGSEASGRVERFPETRNYVSSIMNAYGGPAATGPAGAFSPSGRGSFMALDPQSLADVRRKQAAFQLLSMPAPFSTGGPGEAGLEPVLAAAIGKKIGQGVETKRYGFNYGPRGRDLEGAQLMLAIARLAQRRGFTLSENPRFGGVDPVHTEGSYHYQHFPGRKLGRAVDINWYGGGPNAGGQGTEAQHLLGLFRAIRRRYGLGGIQELLLPNRTYFAGSPVERYTYSGHGDHLHLAI
jgi:hypothetical protein